VATTLDWEQFYEAITDKESTQKDIAASQRREKEI
jgi:hypothetical protein